jgi:hypothetical protein
MSILEFGFDESKIIKNQSIEKYTQSKPGQRDRVAVIAFKKHHDGVLARKAAEKKAPLTDEEKAGYIAKIDAKIAEKLGKDVKDLTEVDRLNIEAPRFATAFTHYGEGVGNIRCLSKYENGQNGPVVVKSEVCCDKLGDAEQTVVTVNMTYPLDNDQVDMDLLKARKYTNFWLWKLASKKFKKVESVYADARNDNRATIDLRVTLDGDPKYQKQLIEVAGGATWAREDLDPAVRTWILEQGLRAWKHVGNHLGFEMTKDKLMEKLNAGASHAEASSEAAPRLVSSYDKLID